MEIEHVLSNGAVVFIYIGSVHNSIPGSEIVGTFSRLARLVGDDQPVNVSSGHGGLGPDPNATELPKDVKPMSI